MEPTEPGWTLIALIPKDGQEPEPDLSEPAATAAWAAASALWHPALLARVEALPRIEDADAPTTPSPEEIRIVAGESSDRLEIARRVLQRIDPGATLDIPEGAAIAADFLALGTARWWLRDLTAAMGHLDYLDVASLTREALVGARAWRMGDWPTAANRLRASFELLTQARERFYPVDAYLIDVCLIDPDRAANALADSIAARAPVSILASARAIEAIDKSDPDGLAALRAAVTEGWADVVGGTYDESDEPLRPIESILWQFRKGDEVYRRHLDERSVETLARRRFGLYPDLPQLAKRFGFRYALHMGLDDGRFPVRPEVKRLWEAPDGTSLESLTRLPVAADRAAEGLQLPWRLTRTMKDDHVATVPLTHWPGLVAGWYLDLRRVAAYSPVIARWVTLGDYFHLTDRPYETFRPDLDAYSTPYLAQAVRAGATEPISGRARHARLRSRLDGLDGLRAVASSLSSYPTGLGADEPDLAALEESLETGRLDESEAALDRHEPAWAAALARGVVGTAVGGRPGFLVLNPAGVTRRAAVFLPDAAADLRPEGPLRAAQLTEDGVWAVVELPAFGYAWVPRDSSPDRPPASTVTLSARGRSLKNESMELEIDAATGGIRSLKAFGEDIARLGQQLVMTGLAGPSRMRCESFEVDYAGPALIQAQSMGVVLGPSGDRPLARFRQQFRLWTGRPMLELEVHLSDLDAAWLERAATADPWQHSLACRWAWPDANSMLRRTSLLCPTLTEADRPETPDAIDISTRRQRTALLFGGLAHHRRNGTRMLDTLLVTGRESARTFRLGVALDREHPFQAALDLMTPALVVPTDAGPPRSGPVGWFFRVDNPAVAVARVAYTDPSGDGRGWGLTFDLRETAGRPARARIRFFRNPAWARQVDFRGEQVVDLSLDGDTVMIDLVPHELARIDVTLG